MPTYEISVLTDPKYRFNLYVYMSSAYTVEDVEKLARKLEDLPGVQLLSLRPSKKNSPAKQDHLIVVAGQSVKAAVTQTTDVFMNQYETGEN